MTIKNRVNQKKEIKKIKRKDNFAQIRRERKVKNYSSSLSGIKVRLSTFKRVGFVLFVALLVFFGFRFVGNNQYYAIKKIDIFGNQRIESDRIQGYLTKYMDSNLVTLSKSDLFIDLSGNFLELKDINLIKIFPDQLRVELIESKPAIAYFDFDSIDLLSDDGMKVGEIEGAGLELSEDEFEILRGGGDPDADYVRERIQSTFEGAFKWDEISSEERLSTLELIKSESLQRLDQYVANISALIKGTSFSDLPILYGKSRGNEVPKRETILFALNMGEVVQQKGLNTVLINALNIFDLEFNLEDNKKILFTSRRSEAQQVADLNAIIMAGQFAGNSIFDFRSSNYSIR